MENNPQISSSAALRSRHYSRDSISLTTGNARYRSSTWTSAISAGKGAIEGSIQAHQISTINPPIFTSSPSANNLSLNQSQSHSRFSLLRGSKTSLKRIYRRASISIRDAGASRENGYSAPLDNRPPSRALDLLRRATSFRGRDSFGRFKDLNVRADPRHFREGQEGWGFSGSSLSIPARTNPGGAAARAAAAAQNERRLAQRFSANQDSQTRDSDQDAESGIGIDMQSVESPRAVCFDSNVVRKDPITILPAETFAQILSYLQFTDIVNAELTSRRWYIMASSHTVWKHLFLRDHPNALSGPPSPCEPFSGGKGVGNYARVQNWKRLFALRKALERNWRNGICSGRYMLGHSDCVYCVQFDEHKIITGSRDRSIRVWDIKTGRCIRTIGPWMPTVTTSTEDVRLTPGIRVSENERLPGHRLTPSSVPKAQISPLTSMSSIAGLRTSSSLVHHASILCLDFDSTMLVTGSSDTTCIVWDIPNDYTPVRRLIGHTGPVLDVSFDDRYIVSCSRDMTICTWERSTGAHLKRLLGHQGPVNAVQMRGNLIVSTSGDCLIKLWNIDTGNCIRDFSGHARGLACVEFSEDSRFILSGGNDHDIRVWDANTGECIRRLQGHTRLVRSLHLDAANGRVTSGSYDHTVKTFDLAKGDLLCDLQKWTDTWVLSSKADYRRMICTSQDGKILMLDYGHNLPDCHLLEASSREEEESVG